MSKTKFLVSCLAFVLTAATLNAQYYSNIEFVENKGQWDNRVKYMGNVPAGAFFIRNTGFTVLQHNPEDLARVDEYLYGHSHAGDPKKTQEHNNERIILRSHAYNVDFVGASPSFEIVPDKPVGSHNNYFLGNDPSKWATDCKIFQGVTLKNVYPNVDIRYYTDNGRMKYDIIVKPGGDISKIAMRYEGTDKLQVKNNELVIGTSAGELKELSPYTYQVTEKGRKEVKAKFVVNGNVVRFDVKNYDKTSTIVIDPVLVFCSFSGSTGNNWGYTATYGPDGAMYGGGIEKKGGFPVSSGAFQTVYGGGTGEDESDIAIIKLSPNGQQRIYATYVGGSANEQPHSLVVDNQGNLVIAGRSNSSNYPTSGAPGVIGTGGGWDIVVTKLNAAGSAMVGSKRIGGSGDDGVNISAVRSLNSLQRNYGDDGRSEVIVDAAGNIYVASCTRSNNFPATGGSFQPSIGGQQDGVVLKFPPNVSGLSFGSHIGGSGDDAAYVLAIGLNGNVFVAGGTSSTNFPGSTAGTVGPSNHGAIDGFVAEINPTGSNIIRSTYIGTGGIDQIYGIQFDRSGFPYVMGQTTGTWPVINATYSVAGGKQFIAKLQQNLSAYVYSTMFGSANTVANPNISPIAFLVDRCENVYVSGFSGSHTLTGYSGIGIMDNTMPLTADALKSSTDGMDFYFFVMEKNAQGLLFGSFFGQDGGLADHVDGGTSRFDENGVIYQGICANCNRTGGPFPTTPGVWAPNNLSQQCNLAMVKIAFNLAGVGSSVRSSINGIIRDTAGCVPLTVDFTDTIQNAVSYEWNFGDGSPTVATSTPTISHTYNSTGIFRVMLVAIDSATCNIRDTSYVNIRVGDIEAFVNFDPVKLDPCDSFRYRFDNLSVAPPVRPFQNTSFVWDFGDGSPRVTAGTADVFHSYAGPGTYNVKLFLVDTGYCNSPDSLMLQIRVASQVEADFETPPLGCAPYTAVFDNTSLAGQDFFWDFGDGGTSTEISPSHLYSVPGTYIVTLIAVDSATCNISDTTTFTITVFGEPTADFTHSPDPPVENTITTFTNLSSPDANRFKWFFGDGDSLETTSRAPIQHQYAATGEWNACLIAYNAAGCPDTICKPVRTFIVPVVDVPNAFTPNSGDINSKVVVRGFGISKMKFTIYNRWGQKVFETDSQKIGWDGRFKGELQPMDVYAYTLEVEFFDNTRVSKKGDLTLIR